MEPPTMRWAVLHNLAASACHHMKWSGGKIEIDGFEAVLATLRGTILRIGEDYVRGVMQT